jgi:hypothetical protein
MYPLTRYIRWCERHASFCNAVIIIAALSWAVGRFA